MTDPQPRSSLPEGLRPATLAIRGGQERTGFMETTEPLFLTQGYVYPRAADAEATFLAQLDRFSYTRYANPTTSAFEERLRLIEGAEACFATATGMAAVFASMACLVRQGSRIVAGRAMFGSTLLVLDELFQGWGIETVYVDAHDNDQWAAALATPADVVFFETPTNPMQDIVDIATVSELAHRAGAFVVVDNVFATPVLQKPIALGADAVVYSATKHIDGQGRVLGGAVLGSREYVLGPLQTFLRNTGPTMSPFNAWVLLKSLETMDLRVRRQSENALEVARWLEAQPRVTDVRYPYLPSHPQHARRRAAGGGRHRRLVHARRADRSGGRQGPRVRLPRCAAARRHLEQPRRRQVAGHPPGHDDPPQVGSRGAGTGRYRRVDDPVVGRARGPGGHHRRPRSRVRRRPLTSLPVAGFSVRQACTWVVRYRGDFPGRRPGKSPRYRRRWARVAEEVGGRLPGGEGLVRRHDLAAERRQRDRDDLELGDRERDADDGERHRERGGDVADRQPDPGHDDPDDVADR